MTFGSALVVLFCLEGQPAIAQADPATTAPSVELPAEEPSAEEPSVDAGAEDASPPSEATPDLEAIADRLLGEEPELADAPTDRSGGSLLLPDTPSWMWPVGLLMLAAIIALRWQTQKPADVSARIRVLQRSMLGRDGHLALVEVGEDDDRRRLLIGYGAGAPRLVAELDVPEVATASPRPEATSQAPAAPRWQRALRRLGAALPAPESVQDGRRRARRTAGDGAMPPPPEGRLRPRRSLVEEVLAERETPGRTTEAAVVVDVERPPASVPATPPVVTEEPEDEDPESKETYTFRGLIG